MGVERDAEAALDGLRSSGAHWRTFDRWLRLLAPLLLLPFVGAAAVTVPRPGTSGTGLVVTIAVVAFVVGVLGAEIAAGRGGPAFAVATLAQLAAAAVLTWLQPGGPGVVGLVVAVVYLARLVPSSAAIPLVVTGFAVVVVLAWVTGRGDLGAVAVLVAAFGLLILAFRLNAANRRAEQLLADLTESQAERERAAGLAERQRLAREMHDVLAHSLSGLMLQLEGARMLAAADPTDPRLPAALDQAHHLGRAGLTEARRAIGMLRDDELPGPDRIAALAADFERDHGIPCRLTVTGEEHLLGSEARLALYRVAQEALTNVGRHARPERVELHLYHGPDRTRLTVTDIGAPPADAGPGGYGLTGMRERAELLGGTLSAGATADGFRVELVVPA
ncbi:sensor histidine kinase [Pseudonocardia sp. CA-107938]|uniref:sensor histidine kinase n=1 Tax=Pseudonocardia sp. CA-107938 TaxID=3240021 RepID=UPI003D8CC26C